MNQYFNLKVARDSSKIMDLVFLVVHIAFLFYFKALGVLPMCYFNMVSIFFYIVGYFWLDTGKLNVYIYLTEFEVLVHSTVATLCVGLGCGIQWILLFMPVVFYYTEFFSYQIRNKPARATIASVVNLIVFISLEVYLKNNPPLYTVPDQIAFPTRMFIIFLVFGIIVFLLRTLTKYAYLTEIKYREKVTVDGLTGLYNRFELMDELDGRMQRHKLDGAWMALVGLDNFTEVNENYGRSIGDQVLMRVSDVLRTQGSDVVCARWGGDKFLICGFDCEDEQGVVDSLNKLKERLDYIAFDVLEGKIHVGATIGLSFYRENQSVRDWISTVDKKLYAGKYNGKNCVVN